MCCFCGCDLCNFCCGIKWFTVFTFFWFLLSLFGTYAIAITACGVAPIWPDFNTMAGKQPAQGFFGIMMSFSVLFLSLVHYYIYKKVTCCDYPCIMKCHCYFAYMNRSAYAFGILANLCLLFFSHFTADISGGIAGMMGGGGGSGDGNFLLIAIVRTVFLIFFLVFGFLYALFMTIILAWANRGTCSIILDVIRGLITFLILLFIILFIYFSYEGLSKSLGGGSGGGPGGPDGPDGPSSDEGGSNDQGPPQMRLKPSKTNFEQPTPYFRKNSRKNLVTDSIDELSDEITLNPTHFYEGKTKGKDALDHLADEFNKAQPTYDSKFLELNGIFYDKKNDSLDISENSDIGPEGTNEDVNDDSLEAILKDINFNSGDKLEKNVWEILEPNGTHSRPRLLEKRCQKWPPMESMDHIDLKNQILDESCQKWATKMGSKISRVEKRSQIWPPKNQKLKSKVTVPKRQLRMDRQTADFLMLEESDQKRTPTQIWDSKVTIPKTDPIEKMEPENPMLEENDQIWFPIENSRVKDHLMDSMETIEQMGPENPKMVEDQKWPPTLRNLNSRVTTQKRARDYDMDNPPNNNPMDLKTPAPDPPSTEPPRTNPPDPPSTEPPRTNPPDPPSTEPPTTSPPNPPPTNPPNPPKPLPTTNSPKKTINPLEYKANNTDQVEAVKKKIQNISGAMWKGNIFLWLAALLIVGFILTYIYDLWCFHKSVQYSCECCECYKHFLICNP